ncbi:hypothetical protein ACFRMQ_02165 [Kitasatospora sp. NPDC056783]|uniref:hypothetical protein n=1 Tax=Kitasatospora sp. NPDC056783 TaxID=3345943 RepID=UPI0036D1AE87
MNTRTSHPAPGGHPREAAERDAQRHLGCATRMLQVPDTAWPQQQNAAWAALGEAVRTALAAMAASRVPPGRHRLVLLRETVDSARAAALSAHMAVYQQQAATAHPHPGETALGHHPAQALAGRRASTPPPPPPGARSIGTTTGPGPSALSVTRLRRHGATRHDPLTTTAP